MRSPVPIRPAAAAVALALAAAGAGAAEPALEIVASVHPIASIAREVGGDGVRVTTLVPSGASPHTFEPLPADVVRLSHARLFLRVGAGFDDWSEALAAAAGPGLEIVVLVEGVPEAGPHVWLDPLQVRDELAPAIAEHLAAVDPARGPLYRERSRAFGTRLTRLDRDIRARLERAGGRRYVAFHAAWQHFARRYDLARVGVVQHSAGDEPTASELGELVVAARRAGVKAILVEPQLDPRVARAIAREFGGETVLVDPLGDPGDPARDRYEDLMRFNARAFSLALAGGDT